MPDRFGLGGNAPPSPIDLAQAAANDLAAFLKNNPAFVDRDSARRGKLHRDRLYASIKDVGEAEKAEQKPLKDQLEAIQTRYVPIALKLSNLKTELNERIDAFLKRERDALAIEAAEKIRVAEEMRLTARAAEERLNQTKDDAKQGVFGDIGGAIDDASKAIAQAARAQRQAAVALRDSATVRLGGGFGRAVGIRAKKRLVLTDWEAALKVIGLTESLQDAILTASRHYHREHGAWPRGVEEQEVDDG
jgi:molecular chaperone GrpE (heat shock protein)